MKFDIIIDLSNKIASPSDLRTCIHESSTVLAITPYASYLLDSLGIKYTCFSDIIPPEQFRNRVLERYENLRNNENDILSGYHGLIFPGIAPFITLDVFINILRSCLSENVTYISDNNRSHGLFERLDTYFSFDVVRYLDVDRNYYRLSWLLKQKSRLKISSLGKLFNNDHFLYKCDIYNVRHLFKNINIDVKTRKRIDTKKVKKLITDSVINNRTIKNKINSLIEDLLEPSSSTESNYAPFIALSGSVSINRYLNYKNSNIPTIFYQHGSYVHESLFNTDMEIKYADINFVYNNFTRDLFLKNGAKEVHVVGSTAYNYELKEKKAKYDVVYIAYCAQYNNVSFVVANDKTVSSPCGMTIYKRHSDVIKLFGEIYPDKKICIKLQEGLRKGNMQYVPLEELAENYSNITIEYFEPLKSIVSKSKVVLSDYFSSEFSNRNFLVNKEIYLFNDIIQLQSDEIADDVSKFINILNSFEDFCVTMECLEINKINKFDKETIKAIEYYSSSITKKETECLIEKVIKNSIKRD